MEPSVRQGLEKKKKKESNYVLSLYGSECEWTPRKKKAGVMFTSNPDGAETYTIY